MNDYILNELEKILKSNNSYSLMAKYLLTSKDVSKVSIKELVDNCYVSVSAPTRLAKQLGYDGFKELKYEIKLAQKYKGKSNSNILDNNVYIEKLNESLTNTFNYIDDNLLLTIVNLLDCCDKVNLFAIADTSLVALDFAYKLERVNKNVSCYSDFHLQQVYANLSAPKDLSIGISYSGTTQEVLENLKISKNKGATTVLITSREINKPYIDYVIHISNSEEVLRKYSMISRITILSILDLIYLKYINLNSKEIEEKFKITKIQK